MEIQNTTQSINPRALPGITNVKKVMYSSSFIMALTTANGNMVVSVYEGTSIWKRTQLNNW